MFFTTYAHDGATGRLGLTGCLALGLLSGCADPSGERGTGGGASGLEPPMGTAGTDGGSGGTGGSTGAQGPGTDGDPTGGDSTGGGDTGSDSGSPPLFDMGGGAGGTGAPPTCEVVDLDVPFDPPQIGFVLDFSGSMITSTSYDGQTLSRWGALHGVVGALLEQFADKVDFGAELFPSDGACGVTSEVDVAVMPDNQQGVLAGIPAAGSMPWGNTPMGAGLDVMYGHLAQIADGRTQAVVLVTDGATNCTGNSPDEVEARIAQAKASGVATYVVGFASGATDQLDTFAQAGGTALNGPTSYYDAADGDALSAAMESIVLDAISCTLSLPQEPVFPEYVKVRVGATAWPYVQSCGNLPGWTWSSEYDEITLCGPACDALKQSGSAQVEFACTAG